MKFIISTFLTIFLFVTQAIAKEKNNDIKTYVETLISEGYKMFNDKTLSNKERVKRSTELIKSNLHLDWMARYTLGRHRRNISENKIEEFSKVYATFIVKSYAELSLNYNGEKAVVKKINNIDDNMYMVNMEIVKSGSASPIKIDYLIHKLANDTKNPYRVGDIITEGVSIINSQQAEFNSIISNEGIDALIAHLREKSTTKKENRKQ